MDVASMQFPPITRALLIGLACVTLPCLLQVHPVYNVTLWWSKVFFRLQFWRPVTCFLFGGGGLPLLFDTFSLYQTSLSLERSRLGDTAAYAWEVAVLMTTLLIVNTLPFLRFPILFRALLTALVYLWSRQNATAKISIFGLIRLPARIYPLAMIGLDFVQGGPPMAIAGIMGLLVGHLWWFVDSYLPLHAPVRHRRPSPILVPRWFRRLVAMTSSSTGRVQTSSSRLSAVSATDYRPTATAGDAVRHRWGSGNKLGSE